VAKDEASAYVGRRDAAVVEGETEELDHWRRAVDEEDQRRTVDTMAMNKDDDFQLHFAKLAMDYYVAGRMAAMAHLMPIYGNLLHHAVEFFLKAALVGTITVEQMKKPPYSHDLSELWTAFKLQHNDDFTLNRFDTAVGGLHDFETLRYPDEIVKRGMLVTIQWARSNLGTFTGVGPMPPRYEFVIEEVDCLVIEILERASVNPKFLSAGIQEQHAREALAYENREAAKWL
jgi:hypothetical protein